MTEEQREAVRGLAEIFGWGGDIQTEAEHMDEDERGWSGAAVRRVSVIHDGGQRGSMILKKAERKERMVMKVLTEQGHRFTPAAFSPDEDANEPRWMAQQDMGRNPFPMAVGPEWMAQVADALAQIHADNLGRGEAMPWLPHADRAYWQDYLIRQISVDHFERLMENNADFRREFGAYLPALRRNAEKFAADMAELYAEGDGLTLTHGDLQTADGAHVYDCGGKPCIIDFGWCYYAPFYIDLASYFSFEEARLYYDAMVRRGVSLRYGDFEERLRAAFRYSGLIYLCPSVMQWGQGPTERTGKRLLQMLKIILTGEFPERRIQYSDALFRQLLREHRAGILDHMGTSEER